MAIKLLPRSFLEDPTRIYRFQQEARTALSISHPNIAHIYEIGVDAGYHFTSMEFIDGITLRRLMGQRRLDLNEAVKIALQVGSALVAAHTSGIIHRDIKLGAINSSLKAAKIVLTDDRKGVLLAALR